MDSTGAGYTSVAGSKETSVSINSEGFTVQLSHCYFSSGLCSMEFLTLHKLHRAYGLRVCEVQVSSVHFCTK
jgi:hypothetical protein